MYYKDNVPVWDKFEYINGRWYAFDNAGFMIKGWFKTDEGWYYLGEDGVYDALRSSLPFRDKNHDKIIRFFRKNYRFVKTIIRKTRGEKVSKKHDFKPFPSGLGLKTCFNFLHKKIEVTRFELATPWSQTRCSTKLSHTSEIL